MESLLLSVDDLKGEIGAFLGYGRGTALGEAAWTTAQTNNIRSVLKSGLSHVYTPPPLSPNEAPHNWSFLRPVASLVVPQGQSSCPLPETFAGFEGPLVLSDPTTYANRGVIRLTQTGFLDAEHARLPDATGCPRMAAEMVLPGTTALTSTRSVLKVWPTADQDYTLTAPYKHLPGVLDGSYPYPPGGGEHAELFKASCIAAAELQLDNEVGPRWQKFMVLLAASVAADRKRKGQIIGYNADRSDERRGAFGPRRYWSEWPNWTYNGQPFE